MLTWATRQATSANSSATATRNAASVATLSRDSASVSQRNGSINSPTSQARAMTRFFGEWNGSQSRARLNARTQALRSATVVVASAMAVIESSGVSKKGPVACFPHAAPAPRGGPYNRAADGVNGKGFKVGVATATPGNANCQTGYTGANRREYRKGTNPSWIT